MYISMFADFVLGSYIHSHMQKDSFPLGYSLKKETIVLVFFLFLHSLTFSLVRITGLSGT